MRSKSKPGYMRTASRGNYWRDDSKHRRGSYMRNGSEQGRKYDGSNKNEKRGQSKTPERPKSELYKKVETIEKKLINIEEYFLYK